MVGGVGVVHLEMTAGPFRVAQGESSSCYPHLGQGAPYGIAPPSLLTGRESHMAVPRSKLCLQRWIDQNAKKLDCCKSRAKLSWGILDSHLLPWVHPLAYANRSSVSTNRRVKNAVR